MESTCDTQRANNLNEREMELYNLSKRFFELFLIVFSGYVLGWLGFSISWILIAVFVWTIRCKYLKEQTDKVNLQRSIASNEKLAITCAMKDLPSWVYFPDTERAEWINRILKQMWPFIDEYVKLLIKENIEPNLISSLPDFLKSFRFEKVDLGTVPVRIGSVKCYDENTARDEIILDLEIIYAGNSDIKMRIKGMKAGIKDFQLYGIVRVEMRPLIKDMPLVGCVSFYFLNNPTIEFNLTNLADILDMPGLSDFLRVAIKEQLAALMVLPNKYVFPLINNLSMKSIKFLQPVGAVRIEIIEAKHLKKADVGMLGLGKSDPYVRIIVGSQEFRSPVIKSTVNPKWNYICEMIVHHLHGQNIEIEVMDEDQGSKDDFLGRASLSLNNISKDGITEAWLTLKDTKTGSLHVRATWFTFSNSIDDLNKQMIENKSIKNKYESIISNEGKIPECDRPPFGCVAVVLVYVDCAKNLPIISKTLGEPDPYTIISIGHQKRHSIVKNSTSNPIWEESFNFLIDNLESNVELHSEIYDSKTNKELGIAKLKLNNLVSCENLTFNQPLKVRGRGTDCEIHLTVMIKVLKPHKAQLNAQMLIEEPNEEEDEATNLPSLEDMIKGTIQPIMDTSGIKQDVMEASQKERTNSLKKENGSKCLEDNKEDSQEISNYPKIELTIRKLSSENKMVVILHKAANLPKIGNKKPDPYVKLYKIPDKVSRTLRESKNKSETKRNTCDPVFEETFEFETNSDGPNGLEVIVYTRNGSSNLFKRKSKIIGLATVEFHDSGQSQEITQWYDLEQEND